MSEEQLWHYIVNEEKQGPVSVEQLHGLVASGTITPETLVWTDSLEDWTSASNLEGLFPDQKPASQSPSLITGAAAQASHPLASAPARQPVTGQGPGFSLGGSLAGGPQAGSGGIPPGTEISPRSSYGNRLMKKAEVLTIVISVLVLGLVFAGLKLASGDKSGKSSDGDSAKAATEAGVTANTGEVERRLIGYWAIDPIKWIKALEANPPEGISEEDLTDMKAYLLREDWEDKEADDVAGAMFHFEEGGVVSQYGSGRISGSYSIKGADGKNDRIEIERTITSLSALARIELVGLSEKEKEAKVALILEDTNTEQARLFIRGETIQMEFPGEPFPLPLSKIEGSEVTKRKGWNRDEFLMFFRSYMSSGIIIVGEDDDLDKQHREEEQRRRELEQLKNEAMAELGFSGEE